VLDRTRSVDLGEREGLPGRDTDRRRLLIADGLTIEVSNLERPQLLQDRGDQPLVLYCTCTPGNEYAVPGPTVNVQIALSPDVIAKELFAD